MVKIDMRVIIRPEVSADFQEIAAIIQSAFLASSYGYHNEARIVGALRQADALSVSLVAQLDDKLVGHMAVSPVKISDEASGWYGLGPLSVLPNFQKKGIGALLVQEALDTLKHDGASGCVLLGDPKYYVRFGFKPASDLVYPGAPAAYFLVLAFQGSFATGFVSYHDAFALAGAF